MRFSLLVILGLAVVATAYPDTTRVIITDDTLKTMDIKEKQICILKLLNHILEPVIYKDIEDIGKNFNIEANVDFFTRNDVVKVFHEHLKVGMLPRGEIFTLHVDRQLKEVVSMFHMLYYAKDFTTFIKTACWMRLYLNEGMFVYALTVAVRHRKDCQGIILPPPYEIYPYYFVRADVIQKAYMLKMKKGLLDKKLCDFYGIRRTETKHDKDVYIIDENIYDTRVTLNENDKLRYFTEDIGLNTYYYYFHVDYPFWMKDDILKDDKTKIRRFELTLYVYQQILARYYLERLSVGHGEIKTLSWYKPIKRGYWPWMKLHNGVELAKRDNYVKIVHDRDVDVLRLVEDYEMIIKEAIIKGYVEIGGKRMTLTKIEDIELLGRLIYGKIDKMDEDKLRIDAYRYLLLICKSVLGLNTFKSDKYFVVPTVLDQYQTALRDPVFYKLQKRLCDFVILFKRRLPSYTKEDLLFPGVKIDRVHVDKLVTYFDDYLMDITNAVVMTEDEVKKGNTDMKFLVRKRRLNHYPFKVNIDILSDKAADCVVRIFLGPKEDHMGRVIDINKNRLNFVELDSFLYKLETGKNTIVRDSHDMHNLVRDRIMTRDLWKRIEGITDIRELLVKDLRNYHTGFPTRLLLPKGRVGGLKMMFYVIVTPLRLVDGVDLNILDVNRKDFVRDFRSTVLLDKMPLGFPLDRHIDVAKFFVPNMKFVDVVIFHKKMMCDMKTRWERWVLKNYKLTDINRVWDDTYFVDVDTDTKLVDHDVHMDRDFHLMTNV
ncbi:hemocyanin, copper containing domain-containing protein [Phthorimaea operculella]|nr:hemocyanin, copper containing domain-containing protein [Phthorimaea operculella]